MSYTRGDIVWVLKFPFTDLSSAKRRPALVISNHTVNKTGDYVLVQITSKSKPDGLSMPIQSHDYAETPLGIDSEVRLFKIFTANTSLIDFKETSVTDDYIDKVTNNIFYLLMDRIDDIDVNSRTKDNDEGEDAR